MNLESGCAWVNLSSAAIWSSGFSAPLMVNISWSSGVLTTTERLGQGVWAAKGMDQPRHSTSRRLSNGLRMLDLQKPGVRFQVFGVSRLILPLTRGREQEIQGQPLQEISYGLGWTVGSSSPQWHRTAASKTARTSLDHPVSAQRALISICRSV